MNNAVTDRNLLVGILSLQMGFVTEAQLISAMQAWIFRKTEKIEDILLSQQAIQPENKLFLASMAEQFITLHHNDPAQGLASLSSAGVVQQQLKTLEDDDLSQSITRIETIRTSDNSRKIEVNADTITLRQGRPDGSKRFQILRPHAKGGLGQVSVAEDRELHREVALKEIQPAYAADQNSRARFMMEAEVTGRLEHPGIVPVYSLGKTETGSPFYVMRFVKGDSLKEAIDRLYNDTDKLTDDQKRMALRQLLRRLVDVCNAIEYAHSRGVLHRDLKPGNIMLGKYGETLVVDWGLAKTGPKSVAHTASDEATFLPLSADSSTQTQMGTIVGTLAFMSPEQAEGRLNDLGPTSDVYCLGATLYCILTGKAPIPKLAPAEMIERIRKGLVSPPKTLNPDTPAALQAICQKAMAIRQTDRYRTAASLANDLELWLADEPVPAYAEPMIQRAARWVKKHRSLVTTLAGILITSVIALTTIVFIVRRQNVVLRDAYNQITVAQNLVTQERDTAIEQRDLAVNNLEVARTLAIAMLDKAESRLSKGDASPSTLIEVRSDLTEMAFENYKKLYESNPDDRQFRWEYGKIARVSGNLKRTIRQLETANERIRLSLELQNRVPADQRTPAESDYLAETYRELATNLVTAGKLSEAKEAIVRSTEVIDSLRKSFPENVNYGRTVALAWLEEVEIETNQHHFERASELATAAFAEFIKLADSDEPNPLDLLMALFCRCHQVEILLRSSKLPEASIAAKETMTLVREKLVEQPSDPFLPQSLIAILLASSEIELLTDGDLATATVWTDEALQTIATLKKSMRSAALVQDEARAFCFKAEALRKQAKLTLAAEAIENGRKLAETLVKNVDIPLHNYLMFQVQWEQARLFEAEGKTAEANQRLSEAIETLKKASEQSSDNVEYQQRLRQISAIHSPTKSE